SECGTILDLLEHAPDLLRGVGTRQPGEQECAAMARLANLVFEVPNGPVYALRFGLMLLGLLGEGFGTPSGVYVLLDLSRCLRLIAAPQRGLGMLVPPGGVSTGAGCVLAQLNLVRDHAGRACANALQLFLHVDDELIEHALRVLESLTQRGDV